MKKLALFASALLLSAGAMAQTVVVGPGVRRARPVIVAPAPVVPAPVAGPVVVAPPRPVVVRSYGARPGYYYGPRRGYDYGQRRYMHPPRRRGHYVWHHNRRVWVPYYRY